MFSMFNAAKREIIVFRSRLRSIGEMNIIFNGYKLDSSPSTKYLGVFLDDHLSWNRYISDHCCNLLEELIVHFLNFVTMFLFQYSFKCLLCYL